jgi:hypothetical protein
VNGVSENGGKLRQRPPLGARAAVREIDFVKKIRNGGRLHEHAAFSYTNAAFFAGFWISRWDCPGRIEYRDRTEGLRSRPGRAGLRAFRL